MSEKGNKISELIFLDLYVLMYLILYIQDFRQNFLILQNYIRLDIQQIGISFAFLYSLNFFKEKLIIMYDDKFLPKLSQNLLEILDDNEYYDITIEVGNDPYVKIFRAHMVILNYRSPYLRRILSTNKKKNDEILTHIKLPNISPEIFQIILRYEILYF